jgi:hypothetical protein
VSCECVGPHELVWKEKILIEYSDPDEEGMFVKKSLQYAAEEWISIKSSYSFFVIIIIYLNT